MKTLLLSTAFAALALSGCYSSSGYYYAPGPPPPPRIEAYGAVRPGHLWVDGYWGYRPSGGYYWTNGFWGRPPHRNARWERGNWQQTPRGWSYRPGRWR